MAQLGGDSVGLSRGKHETELLRITIEDQLKRLLTQLQDLDELKEGTGMNWCLCLTQNRV